jgi:hypothetical protein
MTRFLLFLGDLFERGISDDWPINRFEELCFRISQYLYALAWMIMEAPAK